MLADIPIVSDVITHTENFLNGICGLIGLTVGIVAVAVLLYIRRRKKEM